MTDHISGMSAPHKDMSALDLFEDEITQLSTKLMTALERMLALEQENLILHKELQSTKVDRDRLAPFARDYDLLTEKLSATEEHLQTTMKLKLVAEASNAKLSAEVEDLTASLFNEANQMVTDASQETFNFKKKNQLMRGELEEKSVIIDSLQEQLADLRHMFFKLEDEQAQRGASNVTFTDQNSGPESRDLSQSGMVFAVDTIPSALLDFLDADAPDDPSPTLGSSDRRPLITHAATFTSGVSASHNLDSYAKRQLGAPVFTPSINAIRLDLPNYNKEFKGFIYTLVKPDFPLELATLKKMRYFKTVWTEDLEPSFKALPSVFGGTSLMNRWQNSNRGFWNYVTEGKAIIEPVKGINESFKLAYKGQGPKGAPVAITNACGFCGESRNDKLEHSRLYFLKILDDKPTSQHVNSPSAYMKENHDGTQSVRAEIPLCNSCLVKLRNICEFFAKLRSIHQNIYKLDQVDAYDQFAYTSGAGMSQFKIGLSTSKNSTDLASSGSQTQENSPFGSRRSSQETISRVVSSGNNALGAELWEQEAKIAKLYTLLNQIRSKIFWSRVGYWDVGGNEYLLNLDLVHHESFRYMTDIRVEEQGDDSLSEGVDDPVSDGVKVSQEAKVDLTCPQETVVMPRESVNSFEAAVESEAPQSQDVDSERFSQEGNADSGDGISRSNETSGSGSETLKRKPSKSKKFAEKINNDLEATMQMIQEVLKD